MMRARTARPSTTASAPPRRTAADATPSEPESFGNMARRIHRFEVYGVRYVGALSPCALAAASKN